ncbi:hypothetical protein [Gelidibacter sp. F63206]|uniref:hypothetical protein n=1 Tax=Gelidibacter sp. F63206 TaxID=2926425 RepID=UPI001FF111B9|nr:hypothetical protein [Gelidibacter sp. F63206]MCK0115361.1 hypothetical protein [Gelidibacter sp. F63206]
MRKLKKLTNRHIILFFPLLVGLNSCDNLTQKELFDKVVYDEYHSNYDGIVLEKYIDKENHARPIIIIRHPIFGDDKKDFIFQSSALFEFIKIGDTLTKKTESLKINLKRKNLDTIIKLDFDNIKGKEKYYSENKYITEN